MKHEWRGRAINYLLCLVCFGSFVAYYGLSCFRVPWGGDFDVYNAAVQTFSMSSGDLLHEAMPVSGRYSFAYNPVVVAAAQIKRMFGLTAYAALQWTGVVGIVAYSASILVYFRSISMMSNSTLPAIFFLLISLFLRNETWSWSSETSFDTLTLIQAYPSLFAWSLALLIFAITERFLLTGKRIYVILFCPLLSCLLLVHKITASWVVLIVGIRLATQLTFRARAEFREQLVGSMLMSASGSLAIALALLWPYEKLSTFVPMFSVREGAHFAPFSTMAWLYLLVLPCLPLVLWSQRHFPMLIGFLATAGAFALFRIVHIDFGDRYGLFMTFFPQVLLAEACAIGISFVRNVPSIPVFKVPRTYRWVLILLAVTSIFASFGSPSFRDALSRRTIPGPGELWAGVNPEKIFYARFANLGRVLSQASIVLVKDGFMGYKLAAATGARSVLVPYAFAVPDFRNRLEDVKRFFTTGIGQNERKAIITRYHVSHILLTKEQFWMSDELEATIGSPIYRSPEVLLYRVRIHSSLNSILPTF